MWYAGRDSFAFSPLAKIKVRLGLALAGGVHPRRILMGSIPQLLLINKKTPHWGGFLIGGAEGNRTPVRKQLGKNFSGRSLLFTFPLPGGNKHSPGFSSFIMHGRRKALPAHVLHSDHTRARLVDLPGRMGA